MRIDVPEHMLAVEISRPGPPDVLTPVKRPTPKPGRGEMLVKVAAAGLNQVDALQRCGELSPPAGATDIPGVELSGVVAATGPEVSRFQVGDRICGLVGGGGYAEFALVDERHALPVQRGMSLIEAGGLPEIYFTLWLHLIENGALAAGDTLLVHGGTSGIGSAAIQLAGALGAAVWATAGTDEKCRACEALGARRAINYRSEDFVAAMRDDTRGRGVDVILDIVGGDYVARNLEAAAPGGRILQVGFMQDRRATIDVTTLMRKRLRYLGGSLRPQSPEVKAAIAAAVEKNVWPLLEEGKLRAVTDRVYALSDAAEAHRRLESSAHIGKILLAPERG